MNSSIYPDSLTKLAILWFSVIFIKSAQVYELFIHIREVSFEVL